MEPHEIRKRQKQWKWMMATGQREDVLNHPNDKRPDGWCNNHGIVPEFHRPMRASCGCTRSHTKDRQLIHFAAWVWPSVSSQRLQDGRIVGGCSSSTHSLDKFERGELAPVSDRIEEITCRNCVSMLQKTAKGGGWSNE